MIAVASREGETLKIKSMSNDKKGDAEKLHIDAKKVTGAQEKRSKKFAGAQEKRSKKVTGA